MPSLWKLRGLTPHSQMVFFTYLKMDGPINWLQSRRVYGDRRYGEIWSTLFRHAHFPHLVVRVGILYLAWRSEN